MSRLIKITDGNIELGVIPDLGGMVALLRIVGKRNVLKADETLWNKRPVVRRGFCPNPRWKAYNGHIVWLGPQSEWWAHQNLNLKKRDERAVWPPDPYINNGYFEVIEKSDTKVSMMGPESEFSGVRLFKSIRIKDGKVHFKVSAQNIRNVPISWDLWLNTRVDGYARCYAPVSSINKIRVDGRVTAKLDMSEFLHDGGYCGVTSRAPSKDKKERWAKAFIQADRGAMAAFVSSQALIIRFKRHAPKLIHPEQALVEFYNYTSHNREDALTELEYHAPYVTLSPGEWMDASQVWELHPFKAKPSHRDCVDFLRSAGI
ncbi:MAG: DUF4380 domain-containing protein [Chitinispirillales bacterium]|nr:DUF4380 domain-containing protein [Chitinispirillales bacterium]